ncbi:GNAT family N-acetyltransferase [Oceanobacillus arenosus]|uniref:GNAT family N-acetyltransferase n=1 Tax=Oceanobacillus arenosus TaxID=1229153 RepID=A0A3D8PZ39_9BACI|nr:GNAT family N-acetyltransferase [Oceanobacillus arenosus]RDW21072.1 GNAT family N-acetyltransferase [Oceanobacillus arenosus]
MIRQALRSDAANLATLIGQVETESPYMLYGSGEREISEEKQLNMIDSLTKKHNSEILVVEENNNLIGYLFAIGGNTIKNKHCAYIVIGILANKRGKGIGTQLFVEIEKWALNQGIHRLELTVIVENIAGIKLYEKAGFKIEGIKQDSLFMDDRFVDEYYMSKILEG